MSKSSADKSSIPYINICVVCGVIEKNVRWVRHFGVKSVCFSCGLFFSRSLARREYQCVDPEQCRLRNEHLKSSLFGRADYDIRSCAACRLQRCLKVGMQPSMARVSGIKDENKKQKILPILKEYSREIKVRQGMIIYNMHEKIMSDSQFLESLLHVEKKFDLIFNTDIRFPEPICEQIFGSSDFKELVMASNRWSLLGDLATCQHLNGYIVTEEEKINVGQISDWKRYLWECKARKRKPYEMMLAQDVGLFLELIKTMPFFHELDIDDQWLLSSHTCLAALILCRSFYCVEQKMDCFMVPGDNMPLISSFPKQYVDIRVRKLAETAYVQPILDFKEMALCRDELVILRAILITHTLPLGLSLRAQHLLHAEAERYSQLLLRLLQLRLGALPGARKFDALLRLIPRAFQAAEALRQLYIYCDIFYGNGQSLSPKAIKALVIMRDNVQ